MRLGILADIHGNADALAAALQGAEREGVEALCIAGDFVGYYYQPAAVMQLLAPWTSYRIRGNHEEMLLRASQDDDYLQACTKRYGSGLAVALATLSAAQIAELTQLPTFLDLALDGCRLHLAHGAPWDVNQYIYPDADAAVWDSLAASQADFILLGHTHYRLVKQCHNTVIVNPGSVGQPRDRKPGAAWALIDTHSREVTLFAEQYDTEPLALHAQRTDPHLPYLYQIFDRK